jgi:hypothetical protein
LVVIVSRNLPPVETRIQGEQSNGATDEAKVGWIYLCNIERVYRISTVVDVSAAVAIDEVAQILAALEISRDPGPVAALRVGRRIDIICRSHVKGVTDDPSGWCIQLKRVDRPIGDDLCPVGEITGIPVTT